MRSSKAQLKIQIPKNPAGFLVPQSSMAQLKIQEMSFMLVALVFFFILVGLFAFSIVYKNLQEKAVEIRETRTLSSILNLADSPEFNCREPNCVDADKLIVLVGNENYKKFWPFTSLKIVRMDAFQKKENEMVKCSIGNYPDCDIFIVYDKNAKERAISSYIALCRKEQEEGSIYDKCEIAKFIAGSEMIE